MPGSAHDGVWLKSAIDNRVVAAPHEIWKFFTPSVHKTLRGAAEKGEDVDRAIAHIAPAGVWIKKRPFGPPVKVSSVSVHPLID
jgi:hypothetical protein